MSTLRLYGRLVVEAGRRAVRTWPVAFSFLLYAAIMIAAGVLLSPLGIIGGFIAGFVVAACLSSYLHLLSQAVHGSRLALSDLKRGFGAHLWNVISVLFAFWVVSLGAGIIIQSAGPQGAFVSAALGILGAVFFNPVPELLYLGSSRSFMLLVEAARFTSAHWMEWLAPNLLFGALLLAPGGALHVRSAGEAVLLIASYLSFGGLVRAFSGIPLWLAPVLLLVLHLIMIFRGLLFIELSSGNARLRAFRERAGL